MVKENKLKATFKWRITHYKHADLYTLMDWSNVKTYGELPSEYANYFGERFWDAGGNIVLSGCTTDMKRRGDKLERGDVIEKAEYEIVVAHLKAASKRLQSVNETIKHRSECVTIRV